MLAATVRVDRSVKPYVRGFILGNDAAGWDLLNFGL
jgi:hypothetical protein